MQEFWDAEFYTRNSQVQYTLAMNTLKNITIKGNENVLDIGAGPGQITAVIATKIPQGHVIGIDYAKKMVDYAKQSYTAVTNLSFSQANALDFSFAEQFDLITSFNTLHWVNPQFLALENIYKHLKPNGILLVNLRRPLAQHEIVTEALIHIALKPEWKVYLWGFIAPEYLKNVTLEEYSKELKRIGFSVELFNDSSLKYKFEDLESLANWMQAWLPQALLIPVEHRLKYFVEVADYYVKHVCENDEIYYLYPYWEYMVRKPG